MNTGIARGRRTQHRRCLASIAVVCMMGLSVSASALSGLKPVGQPFNIDLFNSADASYTSEASVALAGDGSGVAAWTVYSPSTGYSYAMARRFAAGGSVIGPDIVVGNGSTVPNFENNAVVSSDAAGNFVVAWIGYNGGSSVMTRLFAADGTPRTPATCINADCLTTGPFDVSMDNAGDYAVMLAIQGSPSIHFFHSDGSAGAVQPIPVGSGTTLDSAAISMDRQNGNVDLTWLQIKPLKQNIFYGSVSFQAFVQRYSNAGGAVGSPVRVVNCKETDYFTGKSYGCNAYGMAIAQDDAGNSVVAWEESDLKGATSATYIYAAGYDSSGNALSNRTKVSPVPAVSASVVSGPSVKSAQPTAFVVAWDSLDLTVPGYPVYTSAVQAVTLNVMPLGPEVLFPVGPSAPTLSANSAGDVVAIWLDRSSDQTQAGVAGQFYQLQ